MILEDDRKNENDQNEDELKDEPKNEMKMTSIKNKNKKLKLTCLFNNNGMKVNHANHE